MLLLTTNGRIWPDSLAAPALIAVAQPATDCAPTSSFTVWSAPLVKLGASLTGFTVSQEGVAGGEGARVSHCDRDCGAAKLVSSRRYRYVRLAPLPPKTILAFGTSVALLELPLTVSAPAAVSASPTVNA